MKQQRTVATPKRKRIHILGAGLWQVPTIQRAKALGHDVFVTDVYEERPGYTYADAHEVIDIRDKERTLEAAMRHSVDGIVCDTTDVGVPTAAYVADKLGLPGMGYETALRFTNKYLMRRITSESGIDNPRFVKVTSPADAPRALALGTPLIVKPVDNQSSRGVAKVDDLVHLPLKIAEALAQSYTGEALVEEWVDGTEVTVEAMCWNGVVHTLGISDKEHYDHAPQVASRLTYPAAMPQSILERISETNARTIAALGLTHGVTHAEYIVTCSGRVVLVEIAARGGGSRLFTHIAPFLSGIDVPRLYLQYSLGAEEPWPAPTTSKRAAILDFFEFPRGIVRSVYGIEEARKLPGVADLAIELNIGDRFMGADNDRSRPGYVVAFGSSRKQVIDIAEKAKSMVRVDIEADSP